MTTNGIVQKLWNYCNVLRDDGPSYGDYVEQLTYLLFLKVADEQTKPAFNRPSIIPKDLDWASLLRLDGGAVSGIDISRYELLNSYATTRAIASPSTRVRQAELSRKW